MNSTQHFVPNFLKFIIRKLEKQTLMKIDVPITQDPRYKGWHGVLEDTITGKKYHIIIQEDKLMFSDFEKGGF